MPEKFILKKQKPSACRRFLFFLPVLSGLYFISLFLSDWDRVFPALAAAGTDSAVCAIAAAGGFACLFVPDHAAKQQAHDQDEYGNKHNID